MSTAKTKPNHNQNAFTLVELIVVMAIISLLIAIAIPALNKASQAGKRTLCRTNLHGIAIALRMYLDDHNDFMPIAAHLPSANLNDKPRIADVLAPYLDNNRVFQCPADTKENYFLSEGSSYAYSQLLSGQRVEKTFLGQRFGETQTPVMYDYEPFHGQPGQPGAATYLFADGHVGNLE